MGNIGLPELIIISLVALLVFGPKKLPELARTIGKGLQEFKRASNELRHTLDEEIRAEDQRGHAVSPPATLPPADQSASDSSGTPETIARGQHGS